MREFKKDDIVKTTNDRVGKIIRINGEYVSLKLTSGYRIRTILKNIKACSKDERLSYYINGSNALRD